jgi:hypothetical protein
MATLNEQLLEFLASEGLRPSKESYGIYFRYNMLNFLVFSDENDDQYLSISLPGIFDVDDNNRFDVYTVCNIINQERKVVKAVVNDDSVWLTCEQLLDETPVFKDIVPRTLNMLLQGRDIFYDKLRTL